MCQCLKSPSPLKSNEILIMLSRVVSIKCRRLSSQTLMEIYSYLLTQSEFDWNGFRRGWGRCYGEMNQIVCHELCNSINSLDAMGSSQLIERKVIRVSRQASAPDSHYMRSQFKRIAKTITFTIREQILRFIIFFWSAHIHCNRDTKLQVLDEFSSSASLISDKTVFHRWNNDLTWITLHWLN